jgi:hypothetical protein
MAREIWLTHRVVEDRYVQGNRLLGFPEGIEEVLTGYHGMIMEYDEEDPDDTPVMEVRFLEVLEIITELYRQITSEEDEQDPIQYFTATFRIGPRGTAAWVRGAEISLLRMLAGGYTLRSNPDDEEVNNLESLPVLRL